MTATEVLTKRMPTLLMTTRRKKKPIISMDIGHIVSETNSVFITEYRKNKNKKVYQQIIEKMMLEEENCDASFKPFFKELKELIEQKSTPFAKRYNILLLLDKDRQLLRKAKIYKDSDITKMEHIDNILQILRDYVKYGEVEQKKYGEVMTPTSMVNEMLSKIPKELWKDKDLKHKKFLDPANGTGPYLAKLVQVLMKALKNDPEIGGDSVEQQHIRYKYIVENMIYACEIQPKNMFLWMMAIDPHGHYALNIHPGSYLDEDFDTTMKEVWGVKKFDYIVGNPPYQQMDGGAKASAKPIYNTFIEKSITICDTLLFITPSRWFAGGKGLDKFRKMMQTCGKIKLINHFDDASAIFGSSVEIKGGVSYFLYDTNYNGLCEFNGETVDLSNYDVIITDNSYAKLIKKIESMTSDFLNSKCMGRGDNVFGIQTNDKRLLSKKEDDTILCHVSLQKGRHKYIKTTDLKNFEKANTHKVITVEAATKGGEGFGNIYVAYPNEVLNGSYIYFPTNSEDESISLKSYLETKFVNSLLVLRKNTQHIKPDTLKWIPSVPLDRKWDDKQLCEYFELTDDEMKLIK